MSCDGGLGHGSLTDNIISAQWTSWGRPSTQGSRLHIPFTISVPVHGPARGVSLLDHPYLQISVML